LTKKRQHRSSADFGQAAVKEFLELQAGRMAVLQSSVRADEDPEALHDYRVALRRIRAVLQFIPEIASVEDLTHFREEFGWLAAETSALRDLDVLLEATRDLRPSLEPLLRDDLNPFFAFLEKKRLQVREELFQALDSERLQNLQRDFNLFCTADPKLEGSGAAPNLSRGMGRSLRRLRKKLLRQGDGITLESPADQFHQLRKTGKKFRYLFELCQEFCPRKKQSAVIDSLKRLQNVLGRVQDVDVQQKVILDYCQSSDCAETVNPRTCLALGVLFAELSRRREVALAKFDEAYKDFARRCRPELFDDLLP